MTLAKKPLTDRAIANTTPALPGKRKLVWDAVVPGLGLRVTDRGNRTFVLVKRYPGSPHPAIRSLGTVGKITLAQARDKAREWFKLIAAGVDPGIRDLQRRQETFRAIAEGYLTRKAKDLRSKGDTEATLTRLVYPTFGHRPIDTITRGDVVRLLDEIEGPAMADQVLGIISRVFDWHATRTDNFRSPIVKGMKRASAQARSRILSDDELRAVWAAAGEYRHPFGRMLRFILLTATRRNEALYAKRAEIVGAEWTIPAARYKTKIDHLIPLSQAALSEVQGKNFPGPLVADAPGWLFTANGRQAIGGLTRHKAAIDEASGVTGWTVHDLRRTARSLMSRAGVASDHAERCLGHVIGGVRGVYDRHEYLEEKRLAFEALASLVERIVNPQANIVAIRGER
jgi:integrase